MTGEGSKRKRVRNRVRKRQRGEVEEADEPQSGTESAENLQVAPKRQRINKFPEDRIEIAFRYYGLHHHFPPGEGPTLSYRQFAAACNRANTTCVREVLACLASDKKQRDKDAIQKQRVESEAGRLTPILIKSESSEKIDNSQQKLQTIKDDALRRVRARNAAREHVIRSQCYDMVVRLQDDIPALRDFFIQYNRPQLGLKFSEERIIDAICGIKNWDLAIRPIATRLFICNRELEAMPGQLTEPRRLAVGAEAELSMLVSYAGDLRVILEEILDTVAKKG